MNTLTITTKPETTADGKERKSRSFSARLVGYIRADSMWAGGQAKTDTLRPVWARFADTEENMRAFLANLRSGHQAEQSSGEGYSRRVEAKFEFQRSAKYQYETQRIAQETSNGAQYTHVVTASLPELLMLDPRMVDPDVVQFVCITPRWYHDIHGDEGHAVRFFAYLRARTRRPVVPNKAFAQFLLERALEQGIAQHRNKDQGCVAHGVDRFLLPPIFVNTTQEQIDEFLADTVKNWSNRSVIDLSVAA